MKKISLFLLSSICSFVYGQFSVNVNLSQSLGDNAILYKLDGSKYVIITSSQSSKNLKFDVSESYKGMMKLYWPDSKQTLNFISENKNVQIDVEASNNKIAEVIFKDSSNKLMKDVMDLQYKVEYILPALQQIKPYYSKSDQFYNDLDKEINRLENVISVNPSEHPFVSYYKENYSRYLAQNNENPVTKDMILSFITSSNELLESSSILRPLLINYLNLSRDNIDGSVDSLLNALQVDTPRGQTVLSEFIDLFSAYGMEDYEQKYLAQAKGLQCTLNDRLSNTLKVHERTEVGAVFENYKFTKSVNNTSAKSIHDVKADKKLVVFWSSQCGHCKKELPKLLENYQELKAKNIEVIGLSVDTDKESYENEIKAFPWINDTELRGWESSFTDTYNVNGTPTYFILDSNNKIIAKPSGVTNVLNYLKK